jgi:general secretion pathway protein D
MNLSSLRTGFISLFLLVIFGSSPSVYAAPLQRDSLPAAFDFDSLPLAQLVRLVYVQVLPDVAYTVDPQLLQDQRPVSFRWTPKQGDFKAFFVSFLGGLGYSLVTRNKADCILAKVPGARLSDVQDSSKEIFIYKPKFRDASYLIETLSPLFSGHFVGQKKLNIDPPGAAAQAGSAPVSSQPDSSKPGSLLDQANNRFDQVIFVGDSAETSSLSKLLVQIDVPVGEVLVKAFMYEVGSSSTDASALGLALSAIGGRIQASAGGDVLSNFVRLKSSTIDAVASALSTDSRFKIVTSPYLRVKSGKTARLVSGDQVSVLGAIVTNTNGTTQQSYDRLDSGTILEISPTVRDQVVDLELDQQVSNFVKTDLSAQPTLSKRELKSSLSVKDGEVLLIAGLETSQDDNSSSGFSFLPFSLSKSKGRSKSQILLVLQLTRL